MKTTNNKYVTSTVLNSWSKGMLNILNIIYAISEDEAIGKAYKIHSEQYPDCQTIQIITMLIN